jgi:hypothetical protein
MAFKPKPLPSELNDALRGNVVGLPTTSPESREPDRHERAGEGGRKERERRAPPTVQLNVAVTEELADMIADEAVKAGSTRRWLARLMKDAGYPVPAADLTPVDNRRRPRLTRA